LKDVYPRVFTRMLRKDGRTDGSVAISLRNFVGEGIKSIYEHRNIAKQRKLIAQHYKKAYKNIKTRA